MNKSRKTMKTRLCDHKNLTKKVIKVDFISKLLILSNSFANNFNT